MVEIDSSTGGSDVLRSAQFSRLLARLDEVTRARPGEAGNYHDALNAFAQLQSRANHIIQGRRGSGKTRLLTELQHIATRDHFSVVYINAEDYKELTYPDILIQILRKLLRELQARLSESPTILSRQWWMQKVISVIRHPILAWSQRKRTQSLLQDTNSLGDQLSELLAESETINAEYQREKGSSQTTTDRSSMQIGGSLSPGSASVASSGQRVETAGDSTHRRFRQKEEKHTKVERLLDDFKRLLQGVSQHLGSRLIVEVDDFYFIRRSDQPAVIDYIHRICKDTNAYLKVATIKHRTNLYQRNGVVRGIVAGHEAQKIDLDLPLGQFGAVRQFMEAIWSRVCADAEIRDAMSIFRGEGFAQAVLASGGVPRDFFGVVREAVVIARDRGEPRVGKRRINEASRRYTDETKLPELQADTQDTREPIEALLLDVVRFARDKKRKNCFQIDLNELERNQQVANLVEALVDSRLLHLISDNTSNARKAGRYAAYLLDVGLYAHPERRGDRAIEEVNFWERDSAGRLHRLTRSPVFPLRSVEDLVEADKALSGTDPKVRRRFLLPEERDLESSTSTVDPFQFDLPFVDEV